MLVIAQICVQLCLCEVKWSGLVPYCFTAPPVLLCPSVTPPPPEWGVVQFDGMKDKGVFHSVSSALGEEQPFTEQASLVYDDSVQRVTGIIHDVQQFFQSSLQLSPESPASCRPQSQPAWSACLAWMSPSLMCPPTQTHTHTHTHTTV